MSATSASWAAKPAFATPPKEIRREEAEAREVAGGAHAAAARADRLGGVLDDRARCRRQLRGGWPNRCTGTIARVCAPHAASAARGSSVSESSSTSANTIRAEPRAPPAVAKNVWRRDDHPRRPGRSRAP